MRTLASAILVGSVLFLAGPIRAEDKQPLVPSLTVVGTGKISARPDMAQIQVGVATEAPTAQEALKTNNAAMSRLFSTLEGRGIARKDLRTTNFNVSPLYKRGPRGEQLPQVAGYRVGNMIQVRVRQLEILGSILDEVVQGGANQVHGIAFSVAEPTPLLDEARRLAMADARRKAALYAKEAQVTLGRVLLIQEQAPQFPRPFLAGFDRAEAGAAVPIAEGEQDFGASITVTYALGEKPGKR